jgi:co-chaperonin GroES (HSP10)
MNNNRSRNITPRIRPRFYPRHFTINGAPILGKTVAIKHIPVDTQSTSAPISDYPDELKVGELVIFGEKDTISINVGGEKYLIAYRNRLIKYIE